MRLSIIIPTYNNWPVISRVLPAVLAQAGDAEVLVVDSSDDGTTERLRESFAQIRLLHPPQRLLPGPARNLGASEACGDVLVFLDGDCLPGPGWLDAFRATVTTLESAIVCGSVDLHEPSDLSQFMEYLLWKLPENSRVQRGPYDFVVSENMMIRKDQFTDIGGFGDSDSGNDIQMDVARRRLGVPLTFEPSARVLHIHPRGWRLHMRKLYRVGAETAALISDFKNGQELERYPMGWWMTRLLPIVFLVRWVRITGRVLRYRPDWVGRYLMVQPMLLIGLLAHQAGLARGLLRGHHSQGSK